MSLHLHMVGQKVFDELKWLECEKDKPTRTRDLS